MQVLTTFATSANRCGAASFPTQSSVSMFIVLTSSTSSSPSGAFGSLSGRELRDSSASGGSCMYFLPHPTHVRAERVLIGSSVSEHRSVRGAGVKTFKNKQDKSYIPHTWPFSHVAYRKSLNGMRAWQAAQCSWIEKACETSSSGPARAY